MTSAPIDLLQQLIRNQCVNYHTVDSGHEHRSVATLQEFFGAAGEVFEPQPGRQSLIFRIPGQDPTAPSLALVPHLDVVPVVASGWSVDPFGAEIIDGFVYGRGALDMLNVTAAMAQAMLPYVNGDKAPRGDLIFAAVADEEAGGVFGAEALVNDRWDLVGADFVLTEVAYPALMTNDGPGIPVSIGEKGGFWSKLSSKGAPGHGSSPFGANSALRKMVAGVAGLFEAPMPVEITPEWEQFVGSLDLDHDLVAALTDPDRVDEALDVLAVTDPLFARYAHAVTHLTVSPNILNSGIKANIIPDSAEAYVDIRALPGMDRGFVDSHLLKAMGHAGDDIDIQPVQDMEATLSPVGNALWEAIGDSVEELEGHRRLIPTLMNVATDARYWRAKGSVGYGVGRFDDKMSFSEMLALFHGHDERVSVDSVAQTTELYQRILHHFSAS